MFLNKQIVEMKWIYIIILLIVITIISGIIINIKQSYQFYESYHEIDKSVPQDILELQKQEDKISQFSISNAQTINMLGGDKNSNRQIQEDQQLDNNQQSINDQQSNKMSISMICLDDSSMTYINKQLRKYRQILVFNLFSKYMQQVTEDIRNASNVQQLKIIKNLNNQSFSQTNNVNAQMDLKICVQLSNLQDKAREFKFHLKPVFIKQLNFINQDNNYIHDTLSVQRNTPTESDVRFQSYQQLTNNQSLTLLPSVSIQGQMTNINNMEEFNKNRLVLEFMCSLDLSPVYSIQTIEQLYDYLVTVFNTNFGIFKLSSKNIKYQPEMPLMNISI